MADTVNPSKKRPAEDSVASPTSATAVTVDTSTTTITKTGDDVQQPLAKRPKLSKKELLLQAKLRLKEAQEKKKALQERLEEQKAKEQEEAEQQQYDEYGAYADDYYYEYHIPPVTGATDSLLITNIASIGPPEKVRFLQDKQACIEAVMKVINERKRASPVNTNAAAVGGGPPNPGTANPKPAVPKNTPKHQLGTKDQNKEDKPVLKVNPRALKTRARANPKSGDPQERPKQQLETKDQDKKGKPVVKGDSQPLNTMAKAKPKPVDPQERPKQQLETKGQNKKDKHVVKDDPQPLKTTANASKAKEPSARQVSEGPSKKGPPTKKKADPRPPPPPSRPVWKRGLAQITGKTLDCKLDLASETSYTIRTQDQGIVAHVRFFFAPNNPKLLEHHPSKRHLQDHFLAEQRLPCNSTHAWKGQDILDFLKRQDERRTTYQPPARRNLPMSHWALIELEQPLLQGPKSSGYFTATLASSGKGNAANNSSNNSTAKPEICFAGKMVWNMSDPVTPPPNEPSPRNLKLSKWGEVVAAVATTGTRNSALVATVQGFYELPAQRFSSFRKTPAAPIIMPQKLQGRKVILPKSRTIGIIIGPSSEAETNQAADNSQKNEAAKQNNGNNNNNSTANQQQFGCCQVLFPNGMTSGPTSIHSLKGSRAILYD